MVNTHVRPYVQAQQEEEMPIPIVMHSSSQEMMIAPTSAIAEMVSQPTLDIFELPSNEEQAAGFVALIKRDLEYINRLLFDLGYAIQVAEDRKLYLLADCNSMPQWLATLHVSSDIANKARLAINVAPFFEEFELPQQLIIDAPAPPHLEDIDTYRRNIHSQANNAAVGELPKKFTLEQKQEKVKEILARRKPEVQARVLEILATPLHDLLDQRKTRHGEPIKPLVPFTFSYSPATKTVEVHGSIPIASVPHLAYGMVPLYYFQGKDGKIDIRDIPTIVHLLQEGGDLAQLSPLKNSRPTSVVTGTIAKQRHEDEQSEEEPVFSSWVDDETEEQQEPTYYEDEDEEDDRL